MNNQFHDFYMTCHLILYLHHQTIIMNRSMTRRDTACIENTNIHERHLPKH